MTFVQVYSEKASANQVKERISALHGLRRVMGGVYGGGFSNEALLPFYAFSLYYYIMISTMLEHYFDNPRMVEEWIEGLTDREREMLDKGYALAIAGMLEQISESKTRILNKAMEEMGNEDAEIQLSSRMHLLDVYERHFKTRFNNLIEA